jgi:hypothetical protein
MSETELFESAVSEYKHLVSASKRDGAEGPNTDRLIRDLSHAHDWTEHGARVIVSLANEYGAFMLRNATALAIALEKEDGDLNL